MASSARRLTCVMMALALSGSPAMAATCLARCVGTQEPTSATRGSQYGTTDRAEAGHEGHGAATFLDPASLHTHHGTAPSAQPAASGAASVPTFSHGRLVERCESCCVEGPGVFAARPSVEQTAARPCAVAPTAAAVFYVRAVTHVVLPLCPAVPPLPPTRAPLALRI